MSPRRSRSSSGKIARYDWTFTDGQTASSPVVTRMYETPGMFSEILKVTDSAGAVSYDFAVVQIMPKAHPDWCIPTIHAVYAPTMGIRPGDKVTFKVRTFGTTAGSETWDFGDGSPPVVVQSDGNIKRLNPKGYAVTEHAYSKPGVYLAGVKRTDEHGSTATARLCIHVGQSDESEEAACVHPDPLGESALSGSPAWNTLVLTDNPIRHRNRRPGAGTGQWVADTLAVRTFSSSNFG